MTQNEDSGPQRPEDVEMVYLAIGRHGLSAYNDPDGPRTWLCACGDLVLDDAPSGQLMDAFFAHVQDARGD